MPKSRPQPPRPHRRRSIHGSFSWIGHRFLREGFDQGLTRLEKLLYFVLVAVSNQDGVSFYSAPVSPASVRHWRPHVIFWKCIAVSWAMRKPAVTCSASTSASSVSLHNCRGSKQSKDEERLAS